MTLFLMPSSGLAGVEGPAAVHEATWWIRLSARAKCLKRSGSCKPGNVPAGHDAAPCEVCRLPREARMVTHQIGVRTIAFRGIRQPRHGGIGLPPR